MAFVTADNFGKHLRALRWRTPFQAVCDAWNKDPTVFKINPHHRRTGHRGGGADTLAVTMSTAPISGGPGSTAGAAAERLLALPAGRHYAASRDGNGLWAMIGRDLRDVEEWSIVPPAASLTLCWGRGGCSIAHADGALTVGPGDALWMDAGFAHRGENAPGSDFLTLFLPPGRAVNSPPGPRAVGAAVRRAPPHVADLLLRLAALLLDGRGGRAAAAPLLAAALDWASTAFAAPARRHARAPEDDAVARAAALLRDPAGNNGGSIAAVARGVGLTPARLSREFRRRHHVAPETYRRSARLAAATHALGGGATVTEAAHRAGFSDSAHLSRTFRAQYGIAPSRWARLVTGAPSLSAR